MKKIFKFEINEIFTAVRRFICGRLNDELLDDLTEGKDRFNGLSP